MLYFSLHADWEAAMALNRRMPALAGFVIAFLSFSATGRSAEIGVDEHLGQTVPMDLHFNDEAGKSVRLGDLIVRPTELITPVVSVWPVVVKVRLANLCFRTFLPSR